jgi:hypothetical protein
LIKIYDIRAPLVIIIAMTKFGKVLIQIAGFALMLVTPLVNIGYNPNIPFVGTHSSPSNVCLSKCCLLIKWNQPFVCSD